MKTCEYNINVNTTQPHNQVTFEVLHENCLISDTISEKGSIDNAISLMIDRKV